MHHAPGPWTISTRQGRTIVLDSDRNEVCEAHAAAALIAAAPDLLAALQAIRLQSESHVPLVNSWIEATARRAINKANGA